MKTLMLILTLVSLANCSSTGNSDAWDSGAYRQQSMEEETQGQNDKSSKDQFVKPSTSTTESQPF